MGLLAFPINLCRYWNFGERISFSKVAKGEARTDILLIIFLKGNTIFRCSCECSLNILFVGIIFKWYNRAASFKKPWTKLQCKLLLDINWCTNRILDFFYFGFINALSFSKVKLLHECLRRQGNNIISCLYGYITYKYKIYK